MDTYVSIPEAAKKYKVPVTSLRKLIISGTIEAINYSGEYLVSMDDLHDKLPRDVLPEYLKYSDLSTSMIGMGEAARKYNVPTQTVSRWVQKNYIKVLGIDGQKKLISEQDVAYCSDVYHEKRGQGKWLFAPDGTAYKKKN